jgi:hypothetical protein
MSAHFKNPLAWLHGLLAAAIGGAGTAVSLIVVKPSDFNLGTGLHDLLKIAAVNAVISTFLYLKQSPLPDLEN